MEAVAWRCVATGEIIGGGGEAPSVDPAAFTHRQLVRMAKDLGLDGSGGKADIAGRIAGLADQSAVAAAVAALAT